MKRILFLAIIATATLFSCTKEKTLANLHPNEKAVTSYAEAMVIAKLLVFQETTITEMAKKSPCSDIMTNLTWHITNLGNGNSDYQVDIAWQSTNAGQRSIEFEFFGFNHVFAYDISGKSGVISFSFEAPTVSTLGYRLSLFPIKDSKGDPCTLITN